MRFLRLFPLLLLTLNLAACDSDDGNGGGNTIEVDGQALTCADGSMTATVNGDGFEAVCVVAFIDNGALGLAGNLGLSEGGHQEQINISLPNVSEGTFPISPIGGAIATFSNAGGTSATDISGTVLTGMDGQLVIEEIGDRLRGRFSFSGQVMDMSTGQPAGNGQVTNGQFDVALSD